MTTTVVRRHGQLIAIGAGCAGAVVAFAISAQLHWHSGSPLTLALVVGLIGLIGVAWMVGRSVGMTTALVMGLLLAWPVPIALLASLVPAEFARPVGEVRLAGAVVLIALGLAGTIWVRRPGPSGGGPHSRRFRLVGWVAAACVIGGPLIGWLVFQAIAPGDIYMRPLFAGLLVAFLALLLLVAWAATEILAGEPGRALPLAVVYVVVLLAAASQPPPAGQRGTGTAEIGFGRTVTASTATPDQPPSSAFDRLASTAWNSGQPGPGWIELDLGGPRTVTRVRLLVEQSPEGPTEHALIGVMANGYELEIARFQSVTRAGDWLTHEPGTPLAGVRAIRVATVSSPSWVAWREIEVSTESP